MSETLRQNMTSLKRKESELKEGHGKIRVLSVGVSDYPSKSGFRPLKQCANDATQVLSAFQEIHQLNGHKEHLILTTSETKARLPSRGLILDQLQDLSSSAEQNDRLLFYFSGHGHRIDGLDDHFLVPQDVFSNFKPDAMISTREVLNILKTSDAKQKIIILDACLSGPTLLLKKKSIAASYSDKFFSNYLGTTKGVVVLSSSAADESSYTYSDNPKLSLFTHYLIKALRGDAAALNEQLLTLPGLFDYVSTEVRRKCRDYRIQQTPSLETSVNGTVVIADFRRPLIVASSVDLKAHAIKELVFHEKYEEDTKCILTAWKDRSKPLEQLEWAANSSDAMEQYLGEDFGKWRPALRKRFGFPASEIDTDASSLVFPGGALTYRFKAKSKDRGLVYRELALDVDWFGDGPRLESLLGLLDLEPETFELRLGVRLKPMDQISGLEANGWTVESESDEKVIACKADFTITVTRTSLEFGGIAISHLLDGSNESTEDKRVIAETVPILLH